MVQAASPARLKLGSAACMAVYTLGASHSPFLPLNRIAGGPSRWHDHVRVGQGGHSFAALRVVVRLVAASFCAK